MIVRAGKSLVRCCLINIWNRLTIQYSQIHDYLHTVSIRFSHLSRIRKTVVTIQLCKNILSVIWNSEIHDVKFKRLLMQYISLSISQARRPNCTTCYQRMSHSIKKAVLEQRGQLAHSLMIQAVSQIQYQAAKRFDTNELFQCDTADSSRHEREVLAGYKSMQMLGFQSSERHSSVH